MNMLLSPPRSKASAQSWRSASVGARTCLHLVAGFLCVYVWGLPYGPWANGALRTETLDEIRILTNFALTWTPQT